MNVELFGLEVNAWVDAIIRLNIIVLVMTIVVMGLIYLERKVLARFHRRIGPQRTGPFGILQSVADAVKLVGKEDVRPRTADPWTFELAPYVVFIPIFMLFVTLPFIVGWEIRLLELGLLYFVAIASVNIVGWMMAGWGSDNRYAMIGGMRAVAQSISYELPLVLSLLAVAMVAGTLHLGEIVLAQGAVPFIVWQPLAFFIFFVAALAELNRPPFDIPVGESEVVGGPYVEYSGIRWSMFFLAEYAALFIMGLVATAVFLGGWAWPLGEELGRWWQAVLVVAKTGLFIFVVFWVRASMPRLRIDQLMAYSWKMLLPLTFAQVLLNGFVIVYDLHEIVLLVGGLAGLALVYWLTGRSVALPRAQAPAAPAAAQGEVA